MAPVPAPPAPGSGIQTGRKLQSLLHGIKERVKKMNTHCLEAKPVPLHWEAVSKHGGILYEWTDRASVHTHIYIYVYTYTHVYTHTQTCTHKLIDLGASEDVVLDFLSTVGS